MLRKISMLGALVVVAVSYGVGTAFAAPKNSDSPAGCHSHGSWTDGFSDGRD